MHRRMARTCEQKEMATINLGRVGYVHKGAYNADTTYQKYDVVLYNHGSYLYIGDAASAGHGPTETAYWQSMLDPGEMNAATEAAVNAAEAADKAAAEVQAIGLSVEDGLLCVTYTE